MSHFVTEQHALLREKVREFAQEKVAPRVAEMEASEEVDHSLAQLIAEQGWIGATIAAGYGGMGAGHLAKTIIIEELARVSGAAGAIAQASQLGVAKIVHFGSPEQKKRWLPEIAAGRCLPTIAVTEYGSGGYVLGMEATGRRRRGGYVLNGGKIYVGNSHVGDLHGVVVRTGRAGGRSLSAFLVEADTPGFSLVPHKPAMGLHGFSFGEMVFEDCVVPEEHLLGEEGDGRDVAYSSSILYGRPNLTAVALGIHQAIYDETAAFCQERQRYGRALGDLDVIRNRLGKICHRLMTARTAAYEAAHMLDTGQACDTQLINAKYNATESVVASAWDAMRTHGAAGLFPDRPIERFLRDAFHIDAPAGTGDIQLHRLGENALGTEHTPWSQQLADALTSM